MSNQNPQTTKPPRLPNLEKIVLPATFCGMLEDLEDPQAQLQFVHAVLLYERQGIEATLTDGGARLFFKQIKRTIDDWDAKRLDVSAKRREAARLGNIAKRELATARALERGEEPQGQPVATRTPNPVAPVATIPQPVATNTPQPPAQILGKDGKPLSKRQAHPEFREQENMDRKERHHKEKGNA